MLDAWLCCYAFLWIIYLKDKLELNLDEDKILTWCSCWDLLSQFINVGRNKQVIPFCVSRGYKPECACRMALFLNLIYFLRHHKWKKKAEIACYGKRYMVLSIAVSCQPAIFCFSWRIQHSPFQAAGYVIWLLWRAKRIDVPWVRAVATIKFCRTVTRAQDSPPTPPPLLPNSHQFRQSCPSTWRRKFRHYMQWD